MELHSKGNIKHSLNSTRLVEKGDPAVHMKGPKMMRDGVAWLVKLNIIPDAVAHKQKKLTLGA